MIPLIFDIKRYAINDGPGIRISIFMKGCPLSCKWCHNPESHSPAKQMLYAESRCIGAQECIKMCPENALTLTPKGIVTDYETCTMCGICADVCPTKAIEISGRPYNVKELLKIIERERVHFDQSGGGVTFSGGEPLMHVGFLLEMLKACGKRKIHRTVDTCGFTNTETLLEVAKNTELFLFDLKHINPSKHKKWTGVGNKLILKNLRLLSERGANINVRIPFVRNVNTDYNSILEMAEFIAGLPGNKPAVNILPYHNIAANKYYKLGWEYNRYNMEEPSNDELSNFLSVLKKHGIDAEVGG